MKTLIVFIDFITAIASAQKEPLFEIKDSPINVSLFHNISLSDKLTLQNGLSIRENIGFYTFETPVLIKYDLSNEWSTFFGLQTRTVIKPNLAEFFKDIEKPSNSYLSIGTEYEFKNNATGDFTVGFPLDLQLGLKF